MIEPIPNLEQLRAFDRSRLDYSIDELHPLAFDPVVDLRDCGFPDASSFYSRPNRLTGVVLPGVVDAPFVRRDIAERLLAADTYLRTDDEVREILGVPARLRVEDALRPLTVQRFAYETAWPAIIRAKHPEIGDAEVEEMLKVYVAKPGNELRPPPHATGGAVDVRLMNIETGEPFDRGHDGGHVYGTAFPEFYELRESSDRPADSDSGTWAEPKNLQEIVLARRVLFHVMTKVAGLEPHPQEIGRASCRERV